MFMWPCDKLYMKNESTYMTQEAIGIYILKLEEEMNCQSNYNNTQQKIQVKNQCKFLYKKGSLGGHYIYR